ncbi:MAG: hypothetical protein V1906_02565 [Candidatus Woesearchaeota archaeon]
MKTKEKIFSVALIVYLALIFIAYSTGIIPSDSRILWQNLIYLLAPLAAVSFGFCAFSKYGFKSDLGKSIFFIALGFASIFVGELIFAFSEVVLGIDAFPSIADIFFLSAYPLIFIGILKSIRLCRIRWTGCKVLLSVIISVALFAVTSYYGIYLAYDAQSGMFENVIAISYGVMDIIILLSLILMVNCSIELKGGMLTKSWALFSIAFVSAWIADMVYAIYHESYSEASFAIRQIDYIWIIEFMLMAVGFCIMSQAITKANEILNKRKK